MNLTIKLIKSNELLFLRSKILRNNLNEDECKFDGDDLNDTYHFGAFESEKLIGAVTLIKNKCQKMTLKNCYQMRALCVDNDYQKKGIGKKLIDEVEKKLRKLKIENLWLNARDSAVKFYLKLNYVNSNIKYSISQIGLHYLMYKKI